MTDVKHHAELLATQLSETLRELEAGQGDALEVAILAGLLERHPERFGVLDAVDRWVEGPGADLLAVALENVDFDELTDHLLDPDLDEEERADALHALDEACAAVTFAGAERRAQPAVSDAVRVIRAAPDVWLPFAALASSLLEETPPKPSDPSALLWRAIESARLAREEPKAPQHSLGMLFLGVQRTSAEMRAASLLGDDPTSVSVAIHPRARVSLVIDGVNRTLLVEVERSVRTVDATCDDVPVTFVRSREDFFECPYRPGLYVFRIDGEPCSLTVA